MKSVAGKIIFAGLILVCFYAVFLPLMFGMLSLTDSDIFDSFAGLIDGLFDGSPLLGQMILGLFFVIFFSAITLFAPAYLTVRLFMFISDVWNRVVSSDNKSE